MCTTTSVTSRQVGVETKEQPSRNKVEMTSHHTRSPTPRLRRHNSFALLEVHTVKDMISYTLVGILAGCLISWFSVTFPTLLFPQAATATYILAGYVYDSETSHFDNTIWTYGTDYIIAIVMMYHIYRFPKASQESSTIARYSQALLWSYASSVFFGGWCHQFYTHMDSRNTWHFRLFWSLCVGSVTAGLAFMGSIATEMVRRDETMLCAFLPALPGWFWFGTGATVSCLMALGQFSFQRPACDIFVAGVSQSPSTFYIMAMLLYGLPTFQIRQQTRYFGLVAFAMMSLTLPVYPLVITYTNLSLGTVNGLLHLWLCCTWSLQALTLRSIVMAIDSSVKKHSLIPIKRQERL